MNLPYFGFKVYGPYKRKDNRFHVIIYKHGIKRQTVSYPKYLMEVLIGRYLLPNEQVHHLNDDLTNNDLSNLMIVDKSLHGFIHKQKYEPQIVKCIECDKDIMMSSIMLRDFFNNQRNKSTLGPFCSKICSGTYGKRIQLST